MIVKATFFNWLILETKFTIRYFNPSYLWFLTMRFRIDNLCSVSFITGRTPITLRKKFFVSPPSTLRFIYLLKITIRRLSFSQWMGVKFFRILVILLSYSQIYFYHWLYKDESCSYISFEMILTNLRFSGISFFLCISCFWPLISCLLSSALM